MSVLSAKGKHLGYSGLPTYSKYCYVYIFHPTILRTRGVIKFYFRMHDINAQAVFAFAAGSCFINWLEKWSCFKLKNPRYLGIIVYCTYSYVMESIAHLSVTADRPKSECQIYYIHIQGDLKNHLSNRFFISLKIRFSCKSVHEEILAQKATSLNQTLR